MKNFDDNVCTFVPSHLPYGDLQVMHVVLETKQMNFDGWKTISHYKLNICIEGEGVLHTPNGEHAIKKGTVFLCLPSVPFGLQSLSNFQYMYVGFMGERAQAFTHRFKINENDCVFNNFEHLVETWKKGVSFSSEITDVYAEGLIHCTFAEIAARNVQFESDKKEMQTATLVKKYVNENFTDSTLSLSTISKALSYNSKYLSNVFSKKFNVNFKQYLNDVRINNACNLIKKGFNSVKDVAFLCGYNDPLYFSKIFKKKLDCSPTEFILETSKQNERK